MFLLQILFNEMIWMFARKEEAVDINESLADAYQVTSTYLFEVIMKVCDQFYGFNNVYDKFKVIMKKFWWIWVYNEGLWSFWGHNWSL